MCPQDKMILTKGSVFLYREVRIKSIQSFLIFPTLETNKRRGGIYKKIKIIPFTLT